MEELKFLEEQQVASELIKRVEEFRSGLRNLKISVFAFRTGNQKNG